MVYNNKDKMFKESFMKKRVLAIILIVTICLSISGCKILGRNPAAGEDGYANINGLINTNVINPLTGKQDLAKGKQNVRPVSIMVNNISIAQDIQTGLDQADIVYETYVEGGITRLMAVFKDITKVDTIGSCRSARYSYVDLAGGHDAIYFHAGLDRKYCAAHFKELGSDHINLLESSGAYSQRVANGKSSEHTLYTSGKQLWKAIKGYNRRVNLKGSTTKYWMNFNKEDEETTPSGGSAKKVTVPFSNSYSSEFTYNEEDKMYYKTQNGRKHSDWKTGKQLKFKNILVLNSSVSYFPDNKHVKTALNSGSGYYCSNGGYEKIKWKKGGTYDALTITKKDGTKVNYNAGTSWVCFVKGSQGASVK